MRNKKYWIMSPDEIEANNVEEEDLSSSNDDSVEAQNNRIYFYSEVKRDKILQFNKEIRSLDNLITSQSYEWSCPKDAVPILVHINSYGGVVFDGFAAVDTIRSCRNPVHTIIDGCAASAATLMSITADKRYMHKHSFMLIHQLSSWMGGNYEQLKDEILNCDLLMKTIKQIYREYTKIPRNKLEQILKRDIWFDANLCLKYGLVDEILE